MTVVTIKLRSGEAFQTEVQGLESARELVNNKTFIELPLSDGFAILAASDVSFVLAQAKNGGAICGDGSLGQSESIE